MWGLVYRKWLQRYSLFSQVGGGAFIFSADNEGDIHLLVFGVVSVEIQDRVLVFAELK